MKNAAVNIPPLDDRCPRCGGEFHCGVSDAGPCPCTTVQLSAELQAQLRERFEGCLCVRCLADLAGGAGLEMTGTPRFSTNQSS